MSMNPNEYNDEMFCDHCEKDTIHLIRYSGHERDSSGDYFECLTCHWWRTGATDELNPPYSKD